MNLKKAKALRRKARELSTDLPARQLLAVVKGKNLVVELKCGTVVIHHVFNDPRSTRGIYLRLKKGLAA